jgi:hypothetical protein
VRVWRRGLRVLEVVGLWFDQVTVGKHPFARVRNPFELGVGLDAEFGRHQVRPS